MKNFVIVAHLKDNTKKYFNRDNESGGYFYLSDISNVFTNEGFFDYWKKYFSEHPQTVYNRDGNIQKIEKIYFDFCKKNKDDYLQRT